GDITRGMETKTQEGASLGERAKKLVMTWDFWVIMLPLIFYGLLIRPEITYGDGPELLVAMHNLGGAHPSGYPLFTMLGAVVARLPGYIFWNVAFALSAIPGAIGIWFIFKFLTEFGVRKHVAALSGLAYGLSWHVAYQATRIE